MTVQIMLILKPMFKILLCLFVLVILLVIIHVLFETNPLSYLDVEDNDGLQLIFTGIQPDNHFDPNVKLKITMPACPVHPDSLGRLPVTKLFANEGFGRSVSSAAPVMDCEFARQSVDCASSKHNMYVNTIPIYNP